MHTKSDKPQTKLTILQQAVQVIMTMELELRGKHSITKILFTYLQDFKKEKFEKKFQNERESKTLARLHSVVFPRSSTTSSVNSTEFDQSENESEKTAGILPFRPVCTNRIRLKGRDA